MTSEQLSLLPARSDDDIASLGRFELAAGGVSELGEAVRAEVSQGVALEPGPEVFDGIEIRGIGRQWSVIRAAVEAT